MDGLYVQEMNTMVTSKAYLKQNLEALSGVAKHGGVLRNSESQCFRCLECVNTMHKCDSDIDIPFP